MFSRRTHDDFHDEVRSHLDLETDRLIADGMSPNDARAEALRRFGNVTNVEERFYETSRVVWLDHLWRDVRYAVRGLRRTPSFVLTTTLTLAVAIGLLTTAFAVVNGFLRPYAVRDPGGLYQVSWRARESASRLFRWSDYDEFRRRTDLFGVLVGEDAHLVSSSGQPVLASVVSLDYFDALGPAMRLGRGLAPIDSGANVAVLSDLAWQRIFDRDPAILDRDIELNGSMYRIVGVLGPEFSGLGGQPSDVFVQRPAGISASDRTPDAPPPGTIIVATARRRCDGAADRRRARRIHARPVRSRAGRRGRRRAPSGPERAGPPGHRDPHAGVRTVRARARHRVRQRVERDAGARDPAPARNRRPPVDWREPRACGDAAPDRRRVHRGDRRRGRPRALGLGTAPRA